MQLRRLNPTSKTVTLLIIAAAVLLFGGLLTYFVMSSKLKTYAADLDKKQKEVDDSRQIARKVTDVEMRFQQTCSQLQFLETSVSTQAYVPTLLKQLEELGKEVNLRVVSVRPVPGQINQPTRKLSTDSTNPEAVQKQMDESTQGGGAAKKPEPKPYEPMVVDVEVQGSYSNALAFLCKVTTFPKIMAVNSVQISPAATGPMGPSMASPSLTVKINLTAYVFREEPKLPVMPKTAPAPAVSTTLSPKTDWRQSNEAG